MSFRGPQTLVPIAPQPAVQQLLPASTKSTTTTCFAVRRCERLSSPAIFWSRQDFAFYVDPKTNNIRPAEYRECNDVFQALDFLQIPKDPNAIIANQKPPPPPAATLHNVNNVSTIVNSPVVAVPSANTEGKRSSEGRGLRFKGNIARLEAYRAKYGKFNVTKKDESEPLSNVASFCQKSRREVRKYLTDPSTSSLTESEFETLQSIGFVNEFYENLNPNSSTLHRNVRYAKQWDEMFEKVRNYHNQHHQLPKEKDDVALFRWMNAQRKKVADSVGRDGEDSKLTTQQIIKLTSLGIRLCNQNNIDMNLRCDQWIKYWEMNGKNPPAKSELGYWVQKTNYKYKLIKCGRRKNCNLTPEMIDKLKGAGFSFPKEEEVDEFKAKLENPGPQKKRYTWEESFQSLVEYKNKNGHTKVPRHEPHLGTWVHEQRKQYRNFQKGSKSSLTIERLGKLISVGFAFSAKNWRDRNVTEDDDDHDDGHRDIATSNRRDYDNDDDDDDNDNGDDDGEYESRAHALPAQLNQIRGRHHSVTGIAQEPAGLSSFLRQYQPSSIPADLRQYHDGREA